jgi:hypothetical protein
MTPRRSRAAIIFALLAIVLVTLAYGGILFLLQPPYAQIVDHLPESATLVRHESIRHGLDRCHVFEFSCSDNELRDQLVAKWQLLDLNDSADGPVTFLENKHPNWWTPDTPPPTHRFGRHDDESESYLSVWEQSEQGRLYVEVGRW